MIGTGVALGRVGFLAMKRDRMRTMARILAAASKEFADKGYDGARVDKIVRRSGLNKQTMYHYFGSKEGLFQAVLEQMYATIREHQQELRLLDLAPEEAMRALIEGTFDVFVERPEFFNLIASENLCKARHIRRSDKIIPLYMPLTDTIGALLRRGVAAGVFRAGVDPVDLYITIAGLGGYYLANGHTLSALLGDDLLTPQRLKRRYEHVVEVVLSYLRTPTVTPSSHHSREKLPAS